MAVVTLFALLAASAFRSSTGALLQPLETDFGWSRTVTSGAASLNLVIYGLSAPFAAAVMETWGVRRTVVTSLMVVGAASAASCFMTSAWQLWLLWGVVIGLGSGSMALTFGTIVANRWFSARRDIVVGCFSAASAAGQILFVPAIAWLAHTSGGWRAAMWLVAAVSIACALSVLVCLRDRPRDMGVRPLGIADDAPLEAMELTPARVGNPLALGLGAFTRNRRSGTLWALMLTFAVCGWTTNGIIQTHFIPAAHDHSMPATVAANMIGLIGIFDVLGTILAGWLTDRYDPRILLAVFYTFRGVSLLFVDQLLGPDMNPGLWFFIIFVGLDWTATVPPTVALCREAFGLEESGVVFGWVYAAHMVGAGVGAQVSGVLRQQHEGYFIAWELSAALCFFAAGIAATIRRHRTVGPGTLIATPMV
ncbi:MFS transporter [Luteococcus sanguinis]